VKTSSKIIFVSIQKIWNDTPMMHP
jgi:hypothetical protein